MSARVEVVVRGRVQGVYFRASTQEEARRLGVTGWVRNEVDGAVRLVAEGPRPTLEALVQWCGHGPPSARVDDVQTTWSDATGEFTRFDVTR